MSGIDQNQWLPKGTPVVNKHRMQHGDLDGKIEGTDKTKRITAAWAKDCTIARRLISHGFLNEYHMEYGTDYLELRNALYGNLNAKGNFSMFLPAGLSDVSVRNAERLFKRIRNGIGKAHEKIVNRAMTVDCEENYIEVTQERFANVYRKSFDVLRTETDEAASWLQEMLANPEIEV